MRAVVSLLSGLIIYNLPLISGSLRGEEIFVSPGIVRNKVFQKQPTKKILYGSRGGASIRDLGIEEEESDEEDEIVELDPKLTKATMKSVTKTKKKMESFSKTAINNKLRRAKKNVFLKGIPYIIRASLNPITLLAMTKAYFKSLFDFNYLKKDESQSLRSAMEEKARREPTEGRKKKRQFKPGQAKTLSDLPQLSA